MLSENIANKFEVKYPPLEKPLIVNECAVKFKSIVLQFYSSSYALSPHDPDRSQSSIGALEINVNDNIDMVVNSDFDDIIIIFIYYYL